MIGSFSRLYASFRGFLLDRMASGGQSMVHLLAACGYSFSNGITTKLQPSYILAQPTMKQFRVKVRRKYTIPSGMSGKVEEPFRKKKYNYVTKMIAWSMANIHVAKYISLIRPWSLSVSVYNRVVGCYWGNQVVCFSLVTLYQLRTYNQEGKYFVTFVCHYRVECRACCNENGFFLPALSSRVRHLNLGYYLILSFLGC